MYVPLGMDQHGLAILQVPSHDDHPWNPQAQTTTETVLQEALQALVRVQCRPTCLRGLRWRSALQTSLSSWNRTMEVPYGSLP